MAIKKKIIGTDTLEDLENQYLEAENRSEIDFWQPLAQIIMECLEARDENKFTQEDLAKRMQTKQSVISRFENMGRIPSYNFIARLSQELGHAPGITLFGDYMAVVPIEKQAKVKRMAQKRKLSTQAFVQSLLDHSLRFMDVDSHPEQTPTTIETAAGVPAEENKERTGRRNQPQGQAGKNILNTCGQGGSETYKAA